MLGLRASIGITSQLCSENLPQTPAECFQTISTRPLSFEWSSPVASPLVNSYGHSPALASLTYSVQCLRDVPPSLPHPLPPSQCSAKCGGGFQVRSVRCLTKDRIISDSCPSKDRPASYKFCGQTDCITGGKLPKKPKIYNIVQTFTPYKELSINQQIIC